MTVFKLNEERPLSFVRISVPDVFVFQSPGGSLSRSGDESLRVSNSLKCTCVTPSVVIARES